MNFFKIIFSATMLASSISAAHAACEDISGVSYVLVKVTENDHCYFASKTAPIDQITHKVTDGQLTAEDCRKIIPPDVQFYGVFFIDNNTTLGLSNMCEIARRNN